MSIREVLDQSGQRHAVADDARSRNGKLFYRAVSLMPVTGEDVDQPAKQIFLLDSHAPDRLTAVALVVDDRLGGPGVLGMNPYCQSCITDRVHGDGSEYSQLPQVAHSFRRLGRVVSLTGFEKRLAADHLLMGIDVQRVHPSR